MGVDQLERIHTRVYPMGVHRNAKERILEMMPAEMRDEARRLLRTGEETAVIFARISRTAGSFDTIAEEVDEEGAAKFHEKWTVSVEGYGHKSVGEHSVVQLATENMSSEEGDRLTDNRLGSYTEFSARFKGRQTAGWFTPASVMADPFLKRRWDEAHQFVFDTSDVLTQRGREWILTDEAKEAYPQLKQGHYSRRETEGAWRSRLGKHAADQFKNLLPASRLTSIGVTMNATEMENMIRKLLSSPSLSTREFGKAIKESALTVSPTLVKYANVNPYLASLDHRRESLIQDFNLERQPSDNLARHSPKVEIVPVAGNIEAAILAGFVYEHAGTESFKSLYSRIHTFDEEARDKMFARILSDPVCWVDIEQGEVTSDGLTQYDMPPRAFELDGEYVFEFRGMTYGDWRDYKRHRMQTYIAKPLDIRWGYMVPPMAEMLDQSQDKKFHGSTDLFRQAIKKMEKLFDAVYQISPVDARYAVTRAHHRPAIAQFNPREAFHLLRLRTGNTAHPFVRSLMWDAYDVFNQAYPNIARHIRLRGQRTKVAFP